MQVRKTRQSSVHLHVRGDILIYQVLRRPHAGSSPRAWRHYSARASVSPTARFISTCVETFKRICAISIIKKVHLHVRGDIELSFSASLDALGSSPRAWRHWAGERRRRWRCRFISTCVETLRNLQMAPLRHQVHLHVRGDIMFVLSKGRPKTGSSPRAWRHCC